MFNSCTFSSASPIFYVDDAFSYLVDDSNSTYKQDPPQLSSYYHLPSPLIYNEFDSFGDFLSHHELSVIQQALDATSSIVTDDLSIFEVTKTMDTSKGEDAVSGIVEDGIDDNNNKTNGGIDASLDSKKPRRSRSSKKDRHSKINTAHGLRDRRMRLSLEVARPFFKLQDMLGYDKASRTVDWLLTQAKQAIEELFQSNNQHATPSCLTKCTTMSSTLSDCEVESQGISKGKRSSSTRVVEKDSSRTKGKRIRTTKESRREARARARKRTLERSQIRELDSKDDENLPWDNLELMTEYNNYESLLTDFISQQNGEIAQSVSSYKIPAQHNITGGPQ